MKHKEIVQKIVNLLSVWLSEFAPGQSFGSVEAEYQQKIYNILTSYADSKRSIVAFRNQFKRAVNDAFTFAAYAGWADGGGDGPIPPELQAWLNDRIASELVYVDGVFVKIKALRATGDKEALEQFAQARAEGYASSLLAVYAMGKAWAMKDQMGTWVLGPTEHCATCAGLSGKRHRLSWFISRDMIPKSSLLDCRGFNCMCSIVNDAGDILLPK